MTEAIDHLSLYRLPWNYSDNGISWLEPTTKCNLRCQGCYRDLENPVHKPLEQVRAELEVFRRLRKSDCMSIAGGEPLLYPDIVPLVRMVKEMGWKPIVNSNGLALTEGLLAELKKAGVFGFTFHVDTSQNRPKAKDATETELNAVRLELARMVARAGGLACSFNATVSENTLAELPNLVDWAREHADIVQTMVFILFRSPELSGDGQGGEDSARLGNIYDNAEWGGETAVFAGDVAARIRSIDPAYAPAAYLNGTANPDSLKWLLATRLVLNGKVLGYVSPRFMEVLQTSNHMTKGTYLAYATPKAASLGKLAATLGSLFDRNMRRILGKMLLRMALHPPSILAPAHMQSLMIIQPINIEPDGRQDMCDSCPDMTVFQGKLVWSCRLEELNKCGAFIASEKFAPASRPG